MCDVTKRRFKYTCQTGFSGHRCQFPPFRSCKDAMVITKQSSNSIYNILSEQNISFPVYCDFSSERGAAWTPIQSYSFENKATFKARAFYLHENANQPRCTRMEFLPPIDVQYEVHSTCLHSLARYLQLPDRWRGLPRLLASVLRELRFFSGTTKACMLVLGVCECSWNWVLQLYGVVGARFGSRSPSRQLLTVWLKRRNTWWR